MKIISSVTCAWLGHGRLRCRLRGPDVGGEGVTLCADQRPSLHEGVLRCNARVIQLWSIE
ncbi:MAG: hypothetical protein DLM57_15595 [Pseudonocardiales bacterium]|nr:MAG: hypothetical protein DLM57_15595 [Pseudonocardiales bacterium]